jgi:hypothetical protein
MRKFSVQLFGIDCLNKTFTAEASDFGIGRPDLELTLVSDLGTEAVFVQTDSEMDEWDNEIAVWDYEPTAESVAANPRLAGWSLHIYND